MRACVVRTPGGLDRLQVVQGQPCGDPGPGEIKVRLHATSLNYHDLLVASGRSATADQRVLMADGAGVVESVGAGVEEFRSGDHVVSCFFPQWQDGAPGPAVSDFASTPGDGIDGFALTRTIRPASAFTHAPQGWSHAEAATLTTAGLTAWRALIADGQLKPGEVVLVLGTGGVAIFALQIAKMTGATVVVTSSSDDKLERARALGADHVVNYKREHEWGRAVRDWTGGRGVDHVIELGGPQTLTQSIEAVRVGGHISLIGVLTGFGGEIPTAALMIRQARLQGLIVGNRRQQQDYVRALEMTEHRPIIDRDFGGLEMLAEAFRYQESAAHFGKICVTW